MLSFEYSAVEQSGFLIKKRKRKRKKHYCVLMDKGYLISCCLYSLLLQPLKTKYSNILKINLGKLPFKIPSHWVIVGRHVMNAVIYVKKNLSRMLIIEWTLVAPTSLFERPAPTDFVLKKRAVTKHVSRNREGGFPPSNWGLKFQTHSSVSLTKTKRMELTICRWWFLRKISSICKRHIS